jgi:glucose/arabinose dehydrogenase
MTIRPRMTLPAAALALALCLAACGGGGPDVDQAGPDPVLPAQTEALLPAMNIATPAPWNGALPTVPEGFEITPLATGLQIPRQMLVLPNGDILVAEGMGGHAPALRPKDLIAGYIKGKGKSDAKSGDRVSLLRDADGDGRAEMVSEFITGLDAPYGLAYVGGAVYVANQDNLMRFPYTPGQTRITAPGEIVTKLPSRINHHWTKAMTASADGSRLYVGIGSNSNVGERGMEVEEDRAVIWEIDPATGMHRQMVSGIRNPTALAINPADGALWAVVNERDELGAQLVPDYLTRIRDGAFYGWPYSYWGQHVDPRVRPQQPELVQTAVVPDYSLGSHHAPLGLAFMDGGAWGPRFAGGVFVGEHGSWNRQDLAGYKVSWIPFAGMSPGGDPVDLVTGFIDEDGHARGRPVGVTWDAQRGALLIADDVSNTVWRVTRSGGPAPAAQTARASGPAPTGG